MANQSHTALTWLRVLGRVTYTTLGNYLVGLTPEENHWRKGEAWSRIGAYRLSVWHFRKFLTYSDDARARAKISAQAPPALRPRGDDWNTWSARLRTRRRAL